MRSLVFSPEAQADISDIWDYTVREWGHLQAQKYNRQLEEAALSLLESSLPGLSAEHVRTGYRKFLVGRHAMYFRLYETQVEVVRILHSSMDVEAHLD